MTKETLVRLYEDSASPGTCRGCGVGIEWYTTIAGKHMPMNRGPVPRKSEKDADWRVVAYFSADDTHWATCKAREQFVRKGAHD